MTKQDQSDKAAAVQGDERQERCGVRRYTAVHPRSKRWC
jgi:hypothetical protein